MEQVKEDLEKTPAQTLFKLMYIEPVTFFQDESQVALIGVLLPSEGHLGFFFGLIIHDYRQRYDEKVHECSGLLLCLQSSS